MQTTYFVEHPLEEDVDSPLGQCPRPRRWSEFTEVVATHTNGPEWRAMDYGR